jgi:hypothetical protein
MKIRNKFVSNSSSSSFIVIAENPKLDGFYTSATTMFVDGRKGTSCFGWEWIRYSDFWSKVNFAYMQTLYLKECAEKYSHLPEEEFAGSAERGQEYFQMLDKVVREQLPEVRNIIWELTVWSNESSSYEGYIDHQSASYEGENLEMFESEEKLKWFLFSEESYIQGGNDNEGPPWQEEYNED